MAIAELERVSLLHPQAQIVDLARLRLLSGLRDFVAEKHGVQPEEIGKMKNQYDLNVRNATLDFFELAQYGDEHYSRVELKDFLKMDDKTATRYTVIVRKKVFSEHQDIHLRSGLVNQVLTG